MERRSNERRTEEAQLHAAALGLLHLIEHELRRGPPSVRVTRDQSGNLTLEGVPRRLGSVANDPEFQHLVADIAVAVGNGFKPDDETAALAAWLDPRLK